jgi:hypothetical protein
LAALDLGKKLRTTAIGVASVPYAAGTFGPLAAELPGPTMAYVAASNFVATTPWAMNTVTCLGYGMQALGVGAFAFGDDETRAMMVSAPGGAEAIMAMGSVFLSKGFNFASMYNNKAYQLNVWIRTRHLPQVAIGESSIDFLSKQGNLVHAGNDVALKRLRLNALERGGFVIALNEKVTAEKNILYFPLKNMPRIYALHEYSHAATHNNLGYAAEEVRAWKEVLSWGNFIGGWTEGETQLINSLIKLHGK